MSLEGSPKPKRPDGRMSRVERLKSSEKLSENQAQIKELEEVLAALEKKKKQKYAIVPESELVAAQEKLSSVKAETQELETGLSSHIEATHSRSDKRRSIIKNHKESGKEAPESGAPEEPVAPSPEPVSAESPKATPKAAPENLGEGPLGMGVNPILEKISGGPKSKRAEKPVEIDESLGHKDQKILRMALSTRGEKAMRELEKQMKLDTTPGSKRTTEKHRAESLVHAEKMLDSESAYFTALKKFHKTKGFHSVIGDQFNPDGRKLPPEVQELKDAWVKSRADYAGFMKGSATERHIVRHKRNTGKTGELLSHAVMERYQRRFITKEVVLGAEEAEYKARMEGLDSRDKKGLEKMFSGFKKLSPWIRVVTSSAMITAGVAGVTAGSAFFSPILLGLGAVSLSTTLAASMAKEGTKTKRVLGNIAGIASLGGIFGFFGDKAVHGAHTLAGTRDKADAKLAQRGGLGDLSNPNTFKGLAKDRHTAMLAKERVARDRRLGRMAAAAAGGAVAGGVLHGLDHGIHHGGTSAATEQYPHDHESLTIGDKIGHHKIYDADRLMGHFAEKLQKDFPVGSHRPPAIETFLKSLQANHGENALAHEDHSSIFDTKFEQPNGVSTIMHNGDTVRFEHGQIILERPGHPEMSHVLVDEKGTLNPVDAKVWHQAMPHPHAVETPKAAVAVAADSPTAGIPGPEAVPNAQADVTMESLNKEYAKLIDMQKNDPEASDYLNGLQVYQDHLRIYNDHLSHSADTVAAQPQTPEAHISEPRPIGPEAPASPDTGVQHVEAPTTIATEAITQKEWWPRFNHLDSMSVLSNPAQAGTPEADFRHDLFDVMKKTGVGPNEDEGVIDYIARATKAAHDSASKGISSFDLQPAIRETADHHLVVHGGDMNARVLLAQEYSTHVKPGAEVIIENPGGKTPLFVYSAQSVNEGVYPPFLEKIAPVASSDRVVF